MTPSSKDDAWFAEWTARWDTMQDAYVPHRREVFALMADVLAERFPKACRVADLGAGAGTLAETILNAVPGATVLCLDVEPFLLEACRRRLRPFRDRARVARCDLRKQDFATEITEGTEPDSLDPRKKEALAELAENAEEDGGPRATRPTSEDPERRASVVGRVALGPPSCPPQPSPHSEPRSGASDETRARAHSINAVVLTTTTHWFGQAALAAIYQWAASVLAGASRDGAVKDQPRASRAVPRTGGPTGGSLGRLPAEALAKAGQPQVCGGQEKDPSPVGATEAPGLIMVFDHIPPDDAGLARLALGLAEAERACLFQKTGALTWQDFWDALDAKLESLPSGSLGEALGEAVGPRPTAARVWAVQDGPEAGHPLALHKKLLHAAGFRHTAVLWRHLTDALLVAQR
jgi:hypothetical protein